MQQTVSIIFIVFGGVISIFLIISYRFREAVLNLLRKLSVLFSRLRYRKFAAVFVILLLGYFYYRLHQSKIVHNLKTLPGIIILGGIAFFSIIIIMALIRKRVPVHFIANSRRISFVTKQPTKLLTHPLSVESLQLKSIIGLKIEKGALREKKDSPRLVEDNIIFRPYSGTTITSIEFLPVDTHIAVNALSFAAGTRIFFEKEGRKISLTLEQGNLPNTIEISETFLVKISGCEIVCKDRSIIRTTVNKPVTLYGEVARWKPIVQFRVGKSTASLIFNSVKVPSTKNGQLSYFNAVMIKNLSFKEKDALVEARQAGFSLSDEEYYTEKGNYEIMLHRKEIGDLSTDLRWILKPNSFHRLKIGFGEGTSFGIECKGKFSTFRVGKPGNLIEKVPTMLSWFVEEKPELALILSALLGIAGFIISVFDLLK